MSEPRSSGRPGRNSGTTVAHPRLKWLAFALLCGLPLFGSLSLWQQGVSLLSLVGYGVVSGLTFALYGYDKRQARNNGQRTPEKVLHALELAGGWPGALLAQQVFRHKTRKVSYQALFWLIVAVHQVFWIDRLFLDAGLSNLL